MKNTLHRIIAIMCMVVMTVAVLPATGLRAADNKPGTPKITIKVVNETDVKVTIGKTSGADGYEVWITSDCGYAGYKNYNYHYGDYDYKDSPDNYINAITVKKNGKAVRTVTIKNLSAASVGVKVRAYYGTHYTEGCYYNSSSIYGDFSEEKKAKVREQKKGYKSSYNFTKVKKGDTIKFGTYEQDYPINGKDPIEWVVLEKRKNGILVMSKYALDCLPYNTEYEDVTWETSTLRKWLNEKFYNAAFNKTEKAMIKKTIVKNNINPYHGTDGGNDTKDKVFLLSIEDATKASYGFIFDRFSSDINRKCAPTKYAVAQGAYQYQPADADYSTAENEGTCRWWLRSPGYSGPYAEHVDGIGFVDSDFVDDGYDSVRPVLLLDLKS